MILCTGIYSFALIILAWRPSLFNRPRPSIGCKPLLMTTYGTLISHSLGCWDQCQQPWQLFGLSKSRYVKQRNKGPEYTNIPGKEWICLLIPVPFVSFCLFVKRTLHTEPSKQVNTLPFCWARNNLNRRNNCIGGIHDNLPCHPPTHTDNPNACSLDLRLAVREICVLAWPLGSDG